MNLWLFDCRSSFEAVFSSSLLNVFCFGFFSPAHNVLTCLASLKMCIFGCYTTESKARECKKRKKKEILFVIRLCQEVRRNEKTQTHTQREVQWQGSRIII